MKHEQFGYFLFEALIALVIFAVGTLGLVNLYGKLQTRGQDAQYRVLASLYANEILSMIISDSVNAGCYSTPIQGTCSSTVANTYIQGWVTNVQANIQGAQAPTITIDNTNRVTITITWQRLQDTFVHNYTLVGQF